METVRLYIGNISDSLAAEPQALQNRLSKYGTIVRPLEIHRKPTAVTSHGFISVELDSDRFYQLKSTFHNAVFKLSKLCIERARPCISEKTRESVGPIECLNPTQLKRYYARIKGTNVPDPNVIPARLRLVRQDRGKLKNATFRIRKSRTKVIRPQCRKTKVWGISKHATAESLVAEFRDPGVWVDWSGRVVDARGGLVVDNLKHVSSGPETARDLLPRFLESRDLEQSHFSDDELPVLAATEETSRVGTPEPTVATTKPNAVESLRSVFLDRDEGFSLFADTPQEHDSNESSVPKLQETAAVASAPVPSVVEREVKTALFFTHSESPFLHSQSQVAKLSECPVDKGQWDKEFVSNRDQWYENWRDKRRDALRQLRQREFKDKVDML